MKKIILSVFGFLTGLYVFAQTNPSVDWTYSIKQVSDSEYSINANAVIPEGWHLYANNAGVAGLESAITFNFSYENVATENSAAAEGKQQTISDAIFDNKQLVVYTGEISLKQDVVIHGAIPGNLKGTLTVYIAKAGEFQTPESSFDLKLEGGTTASESDTQLKLASVQIDQPLSNYGKADKQSKSIWTVFLLGLLGGFIALLTPCVFPMIPVTVSFFTKRSGTRSQAIRNGILYGVFILLIYTLASAPFHLIDSVQPEILNNISTNAPLNIIFFIIFIVFAISFFGFFEITLPSSIAGKADSKSGLGSIGGIFFMALTLTIVSFSCTGPILGTLLVGSLSGGAWELTAGFAGFGLALALPFGLFAIFPELLKSIPKSGGWLDTVKKVLAFVELGLAFKFFSNADLVMHWGILKRETFIAIWIIVAAALTLYLFGIIHLPHDDKHAKIGKGRKIVGVISLLFTIYLIPGLTNSSYANLKLLSGFPPPFSYSLYTQGHKGLEANVVNNYKKALQMAKEQHKPLLIDFTGWACVNCRKMEENVWTDPQVYDYIKNNFILVSLYVDDREKLPVQERFTYTTVKGIPKEIETNGDKWSTFQTENFDASSQPWYVLLNNEEQLLNRPVGYTPDIQKYLKWLQNGKATFDAHP